ncbi:putative histidine kinase CovS; VicK homolog [Halanaerobium saccharolyticum subsp. saccharolyticum DSM 6643]|uniref:histidine kinase n=1 Tax=Halanaerobium saccharolyticum subsp. saccharolyticum DSM 6643 TaxID=1293054 RepID=M5DZC4_9FIRM|nr:HAMP domain-containing sensor histidine kinase [Halanaerobium saccharolyticum]CCU78634.1 putative histidine kinase CovS; VicK homolog [Halanaerobium saccharolyticum subsp. saccharolyticum DSM 6643]
MKKIIMISLILWILSLFLLYFTVNQAELQSQDYLVNINRIQNWVETQELENLNRELELSDFSSEELGNITAVKIIDLKNLNQNTAQEFLAVELDDYRYLYRYLAGKEQLVRYQLQLNENSSFINFIYAGLLLTLIFSFFLSFYYKNEKEIIVPLKNASELPEKMALGQLKSLKIKTKNKYLKKLSWGLDMLQEKLKAEKEKNYQLEKDHKTMVAGLAHDIRTPLSTIKNYAIALEEEVYTEAEAIKRALKIIISRTDEIERLSRKLIKSSEKDLEFDSFEAENQELYLNEIHSKLINIISEKTERLPLKFEAESPPENLLLKADLNLLDQLFNNIVDNAIKYGDLKKLNLSYSSEDYYQLLELENTGTHIPEKELKHIFNSYYRGSNAEAESGFGLGLFISKKIMTSLKGDIYAQNTAEGVKIVLVFKIA